MSVVSKIFSNVEQVSLQAVNEIVSELKDTVQSKKSDVLKYVDDVYIKCESYRTSNRVLLNEISKVDNNCSKIQNQAPTKLDLSETEQFIATIEKRLKIAHSTFRIVEKIKLINERYQEFKENLAMSHLMECKSLLSQAEDTIESMPGELHIVSELKRINILHLDELDLKIHQIINDTFVFTTESETKIARIKKGTAEIQAALLSCDRNTSLNKVTKFIWNDVFTIIVDNKTELMITEDPDYHTLIIQIKNNSRPHYKEVFEQLEVALAFFHSNMNHSILRYIGEDTRDNLSELIIKHCLQATIPSKAEDLPQYNSVIEDVKHFEDFLRKVQIFDETTSTIIDYAMNIDVLFINKKCKDYVITAESIMKKDLHDSCEVGFGEFSKCHVSKSALEIYGISEEMMKQTSKASGTTAGHLLAAVEKIYGIYAKVLLEHHRKLLQTIPQQIALFHNNCFYLAFRLKEFREEYHKDLQVKLLIGNDDLFRLQIDQLEQHATQIFQTYVDAQIKQINVIMNDAGLVGKSLDKLDPITEKCIRQCIRHQELLKTVWHNILSYDVYNQTIGLLLNTLCNFIIETVIKFEDISSNTAEQLIDILKVIVNRGPKLFTDHNEVCLFVPLWYKFNELNFVLRSGLLEINNRWTDGKGPLASQFKSSELKQLIKALFQNTDRRAAILSKIQD